MDQPYPSADAAFKVFEDVISPAKAGFFRQLGIDLVMGDRAGPRFQDAYSGRWYYNCHSNGGVFNLGHRSPEVAAAVRTAIDQLDVGNHHFVSGWRAKLGERLLRSVDGSMTKVLLTTSGAEAVDTAIKAARGATGRSTTVSIRGAWHGATGFAYSASDSSFRAPFGPEIPGFRHVPFDDLDAMDRAIDDDTALVLIEPVPATLAMPVASPGYFESLAALCRDRGALLVVDEVQTGLGRTGKRWGYQNFDIVPDGLVSGKGLGGGFYPIGAVMMSDRLFAPFSEDPFVHTSTSGGAEVGIGAALAVLDAIEAPGFLERVLEVADRFHRGFEGLPFEMRGIGLMAALKFEAEGAGFMATKALFDAGVLAIFANNESTGTQFLPPLNLTDADVDAIVDIIRSVFG